MKILSKQNICKISGGNAKTENFSITNIKDLRSILQELTAYNNWDVIIHLNINIDGNVLNPKSTVEPMTPMDLD